MSAEQAEDLSFPGTVGIPANASAWGNVNIDSKPVDIQASNKFTKKKKQTYYNYDENEHEDLQLKRLARLERQSEPTAKPTEEKPQEEQPQPQPQQAPAQEQTPKEEEPEIKKSTSSNKFASLMSSDDEDGEGKVENKIELPPTPPAPKVEKKQEKPKAKPTDEEQIEQIMEQPKKKRSQSPGNQKKQTSTKPQTSRKGNKSKKIASYLSPKYIIPVAIVLLIVFILALPNSHQQ